MTESYGQYPFPFMGDPEEMKRHAEMHHMQQIALRHEVDEFILSLDLEQMVTFGKLMTGFAADPSGQMPLYFSGAIAFILKFKYNVCPTHGVNHDEEALEEMVNEVSKEEVVPKVRDRDLDRRLKSDHIITKVSEANGNPTAELLEEIKNVPVDPPSTVLEMTMMNKYRLEDRWEGTGPDDPERKFLGYECTGCQVFYRSIPDRMLKAPDDCSGCHIKAAHG